MAIWRRAGGRARFEARLPPECWTGWLDPLPAGRRGRHRDLAYAFRFLWKARCHTWSLFRS